MKKIQNQLHRNNARHAPTADLILLHFNLLEIESLFFIIYFYRDVQLLNYFRCECGTKKNWYQRIQIETSESSSSSNCPPKKNFQIALQLTSNTLFTVHNIAEYWENFFKKIAYFYQVQWQLSHSIFRYRKNIRNLFFLCYGQEFS